jgi:hypothetical protein
VGGDGLSSCRSGADSLGAIRAARRPSRAPSKPRAVQAARRSNPHRSSRRGVAHRTSRVRSEPRAVRPPHAADPAAPRGPTRAASPVDPGPGLGRPVLGRRAARAGPSGPASVPGRRAARARRPLAPVDCLASQAELRHFSDRLRIEHSHISSILHSRIGTYTYKFVTESMKCRASKREIYAYRASYSAWAP